MPRYTKKEPKDGMTRELSRRTSILEIKYYSLILVFDYLDMENYKANGTDHTKW
jgi:hypothetical protein